MRACSLFLIILILGTTQSSSAQTPIGGLITSNTTLTQDNSPYVVTSDIRIGGPVGTVTLTIEPGCELRFQAGTGLYVGYVYQGSFQRYGRLSCIGTEFNRIVFTSSATTPQAGDWKGIKYTSLSYSDSLINCDILYAGGEDISDGYPQAAVYATSESSSTYFKKFRDCVIDQCLGAGLYTYKGIDSVTIESCEISNAESYAIRDNTGHSKPYRILSNSIHDCGAGIYFWATSTSEIVIQGNSVTDCGGYPVYIREQGIAANIQSNSYTGNEYQAIRCGGPCLNGGTMYNDGLPYVVISNIEIGLTNSYPQLKTLTIQPGCSLKFEPNVGLYVGRFYNAGTIKYGHLEANGTPTDRITFTSNASNPQPGDWIGIKYTSASFDDSLVNCDILFAGAVDNLEDRPQAAVYASSLYSGTYYKKFRNCVIDQSLGDGLHTYSTSGGDSTVVESCEISNTELYAIRDNYPQQSPYRILSNTIHDCGAGIYFAATSTSEIVIQNNTITDCGGYPIYILTQGIAANIQNNTYTGNEYQAIRWGGPCLNGGTMYNDGLPYVVISNIQIGLTDSYPLMKTLTIQPGCSLKFESGIGLYVGNTTINPQRYGHLEANGLPLERIVFTSNAAIPQPGDWVGIKYTGASFDDSLSYCDVKYAGAVDAIESTPQAAVYASSLSSGTHYKKLDNCLVDSTLGNGVRVYKNVDSILISNSTIQNSSATGIYDSQSSRSQPFRIESNAITKNAYGIKMLGHSSSQIAITNNNISFNNGYPIGILIQSRTARIQGNTVVGNEFQAIYWGGPCLNGGTMYNDGIPYVIGSDIRIGLTDSWPQLKTLTIEPGCELRFEPGTGLYVGWSTTSPQRWGHLEANGTPTDRIVFTSNAAIPQPGDWVGIKYTGASFDDSLLNCDIFYAGAVDGIEGTPQSAIYTNSRSSSPHFKKIDGCEILFSQGDGLRLDKAVDSIHILNTVVRGCTGTGVKDINRTAPRRIRSSSIIENSIGVEGYGGTIGGLESYSCDIYDNTDFNVSVLVGGHVNAQFNYWGTDVPAEIEAKLSGDVDYGNYVSVPNYMPLVVSILEPGIAFDVNMNDAVLVRVQLTDEENNYVTHSQTDYCRIEFNNGESDLYLVDDGSGADIAAEDGVFTGIWYPSLNGQVQLTAKAYAPSFGSGSAFASGTVNWTGSSNCIAITDELSICADNIVEGPPDVYNCDGNVSVGNILQFSGSIVVDKQVFLPNPEIRGAGPIIIKDIEGTDHVIYSLPYAYTFYAHDDSLFNYDALMPLQFTLFGFNLVGGHIGVDPTGPTVKVDYVVSYPPPVDDWMSKIRSLTETPSSYFEQVSFGTTFDRSTGVFPQGGIGPFSIDYKVFKLSNLSINWDKFEQKIGGSAKLTWKNPKDPINKSSSGFLPPPGEDVTVEIRDKSGVVLKSGSLSEMEQELQALSGFFPSGIGLEIEFLENKLNKIILVLEGNLYLGATGLRITQFTAGIEDLQTDPTIIGSIDIATNIPPVPVFGDPIKIDDFGVRWKRTLFRGEGALQIFGYEVSSAYLEADALAVSLSGGGTLSFGTYMNGRVDWTMAIDHANGSAEMTLQIPENVPWYLSPWKNEKIASTYISMTNFNDWRAQITFLGLSAAVRRYFNFDAPYDHWEYGRNLNSLTPLFRRTLGSQQITDYIIPAGCPQIMIAARNEVNAFDFSMTSPSLVVFDSTHTNYLKSTTEMVTVMVINNPEPGTWQFETNQTGDIEVEVLASDQLPSVAMTEPSVIKQTDPSIGLQLSDFSDTLDVTIYYDTDRRGYNGVPITSFDAINSADVSMTWNTFDIPSGEYFIYCRVDDGENAPVMVYAPGSILIESASTLEKPQNVSAVQIGDSLEVSWDEPLSADIIIANVTLKDLSQGVPWTYSTADTSNNIYITDYQSGMNYELWVQFEDSVGNIGPKSDLIQIGLMSQSANNPPYFSFDQDSIWYLTVGEPGSTPITAVDLDGNSLNYSVTTLPVGLSISGDSLNWTPTEDQTGYYSLEIVVDDGLGGSDTARIGAAVLSVEQVAIDIALSGAILYEGDNQFVTVSHFNNPDAQVSVTVINQRTEDQVNINCLRSNDFDYTGQFELISDGSGIFAVEHGDTIQAEYSYNSTAYTTTAVFDTTGQPTDVTPPNAIADLNYVLINSDTLILWWTTPGDDSTEGQAMYYDMRYNYTGIATEDNYVNSYKYAELGYPSGPGEIDSLTIPVSDLDNVSGENYLYITNRAADELNQYSPLGNTLRITLVQCCQGTRGNANNDPGDLVNIADITYLVSYLFGIPSGPEPVCPEEANANSDPSELANIADITYLVNYLFGIPNGPEPQVCP